MANGNSARAALREALRRLIDLDAGTNGLNALSELDPDCSYAARALDEKPVSERGPLFGAPVLLKDNINTAGKTHTRAGALSLKDHFAWEDAFVVSRLRGADALILGKANMTEFANYVSDDMPNGYSALGGQVKSPHTGGDPGGSSSGCGAAVGGGIVDFAIGTETMGSILCPAQMCGAVGVKPTAGLVSRTGILPISSTLDTAGPITSSVRGAALLLSVIAGYDPADAATHVLSYRPKPDFLSGLSDTAIRGARIGISRTVAPSPGYAPVFERLLSRLSRMGAELIEADLPDVPKGAAEAIMRFEFRPSLDAYLARYGGDIRTMEDVVSCNLRNAERAVPYGQNELLDAFFAHGENAAGNEREYLRALLSREETLEIASERFAANRLDAIVAQAGWCALAPFAGLPYGTVPTGDFYRNGEPAGCAFIAPPFGEAKLLGVLFALEADIRESRG